MVSGAHHNLLRPEAMEAMFVMWRVTRDIKYREWAWTMFSAWQTFCRVRKPLIIFFYLPLPLSSSLSHLVPISSTCSSFAIEFLPTV